MRRSIPLLVVLLTTVTACGRAPENEGPPGETTSSEDLSELSNASEQTALPPELISPRRRASRDTGPDVGPETAPGVAFDYRYSFRLGAERVAEAQQAHQRLCERYTVNRCRITGMVYRAANAEDVEAMLTFRVDPAIAGQFGREGVQAVTDADGVLVESEITGSDVGGRIETSNRTIAELTTRLEEIEARLRAARPNATDKGQLEYDAEALRQQIRDLRTNRDEARGSLATTPILFRYGSGGLAPGPAQPATLREAVRETGDDLLYSLNLLLVLLVRLLPWGVAGLLGWGVIRYLRRRFAPKKEALEAEPLGI